MTAPNQVRTKCPRCAASTISPESGTCDVCGYRSDAAVVVAGPDALMEIVTRQLLHEFDIVDIAGRREGALVARAIEKNGGRAVLLKVVQRRDDDPGAKARFRSVLETYQRLDHPHLVPILRFGTTDSLLWLTMPDTGAKPLREELKGDGRLDPRAARRIATQLVSALEYLHRQGFVHGGVKAENILVDSQGWAWLADPAFARPLPPRRRTPAQGTKVVAPGDASTSRHSWMAPEDVSRSERLPTSDQFGLAAVLFEAISGEAPLKPGEQIGRFRVDVPAAISNALARALDAQPARRFPSCADFLFALEQTPERRPSGRGSAGALIVHDWERPEDLVKPARNPAQIIVWVVVAILLTAAVPLLLPIFRSPDEPIVVAAPAAPAVVALTDTVPAPAAPRTVDAAPARAETPVATPERRPVPPSSIPRPSRPPAAAESAPVTPAKLTINASPWGQVFVDDVLIGNTPRANIELAPGEHVVRVSRQGFSTFTRTIRLQAGESLRITDIVLTPVSP